MKIYQYFLLGSTRVFLENLPESDRSKIHSAINFLANGDFKSVHIKTLKCSIRELIVKQYRIVFFIHYSEIYFLRAFVKKTNKTPRREIKIAEKMQKQIINN